MSDKPRLLTIACECMTDAQMSMYAALSDGVITAREAREIVAKMDDAFYFTEQAEGVETQYEYARKHGVEAGLNRPNREKVASLVEYRMRREARQRDTASNSDGPDAA